MRIKKKSVFENILYALKKLRKKLDSTTVQSQFFMEGVEFILDLLWTWAVLACTEIQQDVDLEIDKQSKKVKRSEWERKYFKNYFSEQEGQGAGGTDKQTSAQTCKGMNKGGLHTKRTAQLLF